MRGQADRGQEDGKARESVDTETLGQENKGHLSSTEEGHYRKDRQF